MTTSNVAGTARSYTYNGDGLVQTRNGGVGASFLWDPSTSIQREVKQNNDNIVYGLGPLYVVKADATTLTFARDGSKNVRAEVNGAGAVTGAFRYRSYGQLAQSTTAGPTYLGFASQLLDPSGLYYMRARWYDSAPGRFVTRDPLQGEITSPLTMNAFNYAGANPSLRRDPSGLRVSLGESDEGGTCDAMCVTQIATTKTGNATDLPPWDYTTTSVSIGPVVVERSVDRFGQAYYAFGAGAGIPPVGLSIVQGVMKDRSYSPDDTDRFLTGPAFTAQIGFLTWGHGVVISPLANNSANESGFYTPQVSVAATWGFRESDVLNWRPFPWPWP